MRIADRDDGLGAWVRRQVLHNIVHTHPCAKLTQAIAVGGVPRHIRGPVTGHGTENQLAALRHVLPALVQQTHAHVPDERHEHTPVLGEIGVFGNQLRVHAARGKRMVVIGDHRLEVVDAA